MKKYILGFCVTILSIYNIANCQTIWDNYVSSFIDGLAAVKINGKFGFIDKSGKIVVPCVYEDYYGFVEGLAAVKINGKYGFIDKSRKIVIPCVFDRVRDFSEGFTAVEINGKYGFIDTEGKLSIPCIYDDVGSFSEGFALVLSDNLWGYINKNNILVIPFQYELAYDFSDGLAAVSSGKAGLSSDGDFLYGFIDNKGQFVYPEKFVAIIPSGKAYENGTEMTSFHDSVCIVIDNLNGLQLINTKGEMKKINEQYDFYSLGYGKQFYEGLAIVNINGKYGFIDRNLNVIIPCVFDRAHSFSEGFATVEINGKYGVIDKKGKLQIACIYEDYDYFYFIEELACVKYNGKYGVINKEGVAIIPFEYDYGNIYFSDGIAKVFKNGKWRFINKSNKCVLNCD